MTSKTIVFWSACKSHGRVEWKKLYIQFRSPRWVDTGIWIFSFGHGGTCGQKAFSLQTMPNKSELGCQRVAEILGRSTDSKNYLNLLRKPKEILEGQGLYWEMNIRFGQSIRVYLSEISMLQSTKIELKFSKFGKSSKFTIKCLNDPRLPCFCCICIFHRF